MHRIVRSDSPIPTVLRFCVAGAALLFLLSAVWGALPDAPDILRKADENALAGYEQISLTTPCRQPVLEEYYDRLPQTAVTAQAPQTQ